MVPPKRRIVVAVLQTLLPVLGAVAVVLWFLPPKPYVPPPLPADWTPGCRLITADWHRLEEEPGRYWSPYTAEGFGERFLLYSYQEPSEVRPDLIGADGSVTPVAVDHRGWLVNPTRAGDRLWFLQRAPSMVGFVAVDPGTGRVLGHHHHPVLDRRRGGRNPISADGPFLLADGSLVTVCFRPADEPACLLMRLDPNAGTFTAVGIPKEFGAYWAHPSGALSASTRETTHDAMHITRVVAIDPLTGAAVDAAPRLEADYRAWSGPQARPRLTVETQVPRALTAAFREQNTAWTALAFLRHTIWERTLGSERTADAIAKTARVTRIVGPEGWGGGGLDPHVLGGDLAVTTDTTIRPWVTASSRRVAEVALWTLPLPDGQLLVLQAVQRVPDRYAPGVLRLGLLSRNDPAVRWLGWMPLPEHCAEQGITAGIAPVDGGLALVLTTVRHRSREERAFGASSWCRIPLPAGVTLPAGHRLRLHSAADPLGSRP
ncbi:MAG TPA: hypothetical protein VEI97_15665 [bacterium]|nr:hypothetical protein [bacterium]